MNGSKCKKGAKGFACLLMAAAIVLGGLAAAVAPVNSARADEDEIAGTLTPIMEFATYDNNHLLIKWNAAGGTGRFLSFNIDLVDDITQNIIINGKTVREWQTENANNIARIYAYGPEMRVYFDNPSVLSLSSLDTLQINAGMRWYKPEDDNDHGTGDRDVRLVATDYEVKQTVYWQKTTAAGGGYAWVKQLKYDGNAIASDAVTVTAQPTKTEYAKGEVFNPAGMKISAKYRDGSEAEVDVTSAMVKTGAFTADGEQTVTLEYNGKEFTCTVTVGTVQSISVKTQPQKKTYDIGERLDFSDMVLLADYGGGATKDISVSPEMISGYDPYTVGSQTVTVRLGELSVNVEITVADSMPNSSITVDLSSDTYTTGAPYNTPEIQFSFTGIDGAGTARRILRDMDQCADVGERVLINGTPFGDLKRDWVLRIDSKGDKIEIAMDGNKKLADVDTVTLLKGFRYYTYSEDNTSAGNSRWKNYTPIPGAVLKNDIVLKNDKFLGKWQERLKQDNGEPASDAVTITNTKTVYNLDEPADTGSISVHVKYESGREEDITVTADMIKNPDFSAEVGSKKIELYVCGYEYETDVTVRAVVLKELVVETPPTNTVANLGRDFNLEGLSLKAVWMDRDTEQEIERTAVDPKDIEVSGYDAYKSGAQTLTLSYGGKSADIDIEVKDLNPEINLTLMYPGGYSLYEDTSHHNPIFYVELNGFTGYARALVGMEKFPHVADYIAVTYNDGATTETVSELIEKGWVTGVRFYTTCVVLLMDDVLQPSENAFDIAKERNESLADKEPIIFDSITVKAGFQYYTNDVDNWPGDNWNYQKIDGCFLRSDVVLENIAGIRWRRPLKKTDGGQVASDALTVSVMPKTEYVQGEAFNVTGMMLHVKYGDGGEEDVAVADSWISGYKKDTVGEQTVTVSFNGHTVSFAVTVTEKPAEPEKPDGGCGCGSEFGSVGTFAAAAAVLAGCLFSILLFRRKKA